MNEKLKELIAQVGGIGHDDDGNELTPALVGKSLEKFALLIVKECCDKIEREYKYALGEKTQWAMSQDVQDLLKEHFGVE